MLNAIPEAVKKGVLEMLGQRQSLQNFSFSGGGCINHGGRLTTSSGDFFLKWNDARTLKNMFEAESKGLLRLHETGTVHVPEVIGVGIHGDYQFLLLSLVRQHPQGDRYWEEAGRQLASLHRCYHSSYGLDHNNYIGSLSQRNEQANTWTSFFVEHRIRPQVRLARDNDRLGIGDVDAFERLCGKGSSLFPEEVPSLVHGDLWRGNLINSDAGGPCFIDPAVYFGHREVDLAMTKLFGGFHSDFYATYQDAYPLLPGHQERVDLYNLYPLLVHLNLFGSSYYQDVMQIARRFA
jgi:fructosamine-3-kinase